MPREIERRAAPASVELREGKDGAAPMLVGYAALYDSMSEDLGFREIIRPGAFDRAIREKHDVLARAEHSASMLLGRCSSGTLRLSVDSRDLKYEIDVPDTQAGRDVLTLVRRGDVKQSSFAFAVSREQQRWSTTEDGEPLREILDVDLIDVAPVAMPAYSATTVSARALEEAKEMTEKKLSKVERRAALLAKPVEQRMLMQGSGYGCPCCMAGSCTCCPEFSYRGCACCAAGSCPCCVGDKPCVEASTCANGGVAGGEATRTKEETRAAEEPAGAAAPPSDATGGTFAAPAADVEAQERTQLARLRHQNDDAA